MPERTIQKIMTYDESHGKFAGRHYIEISYETWKTFELGKLKTKVQCEVNSLLKNKKETVFAGSERGLCHPRNWYDDKERNYYDLVFSSTLVQKIGIREGLLIDLLLIKVYRCGGTVIQIFPKRLVLGKMEIKLDNLLEQTINRPDNLIEHNFSDNFYADLVIEINRAFGFKLYNSTLVLTRKLLENLLIDLFRTKYGMQDIEKFYNTNKNRHHDFAKLVDTLQAELSDFKPFSTAFSKNMIEFLDKFREKSNSAAHSIDIQPNFEYILQQKKDLNHYCEIFDSMISKIK